MTIEEEEEVDIAEVSKSLKKLQQEEKDLQSTIAGFCDELGIGKPFK